MGVVAKVDVLRSEVELAKATQAAKPVEDLSPAEAERELKRLAAEIAAVPVRANV